jgi:AcrR family transcriptional regulator
MSASKRDELVQKALKIFYRDGFHATGMDRLVKETGISKTSMYKHFRTKDDLILATLRLRDEIFRNQLIRRIEELSSDPKDQLLALFTALDEWFKGSEFRGCMFINAAGEYPVRGTQIHDMTAEHKKLLHTYVTEIALRAGAKNPEELAKHLLFIKEGAIVTAHIKGPDGVADDAREAARAILQSAFK